MRRRVRRAAMTLLAFAAAGFGVIATAAPEPAVAVTAAPPATAAEAAVPPADAFDAGLIISDENFYDPNAMTRDGIQSFLESKRCLPTGTVPCLADYRQTTTSQPAQPGHCAAYHGARSQRASTIIADVAQACGISPRVLLVLLQKEQSLLTRPSAYGYQRATGYACPDSADCDTAYFGFFNQVYNAAWQFREYSASSGWRYHIGAVPVQYSPNPACGRSVVDIRNQATANLYNYTPYQPDRATLAHPNAPASACSTYGNLNFFRIYTQWFGDPTVDALPDWWGDCLLYPGGHGCPADATETTVP